MSVRKKYIGREYGSLTIRDYIPGTHLTHARAVCECKCGQFATIDLGHLKSGHTVSCGCKRITHHMTLSPEYRTWQLIKTRCFDTNNDSYPRYGGSGIKIDPLWLGEHGFENFYAEVGAKPTPEHSIDRWPNPRGNYEPGNVRWATLKEQARNKRSNRLLEFQGKIQCVSAWAEELNMSVRALYERLRQGWSVERTLTERIHR